MFELHHLTAQEQLDWLRRGEVSPTELTRHYLDRIERLDSGLGAFMTVTPDAAIARARHIEQNVPKSAALWGLPFGDKDLWQRAGVRTTFGSRLSQDFVPEQSDDIVTALDAAGGVSLGKTNAPEFGLPAYTESRVAPPARTPWDVTLGAGGSSGGAAVAVSAGLLPVAPGSDGGGSIRIPAAATGLVGLKPSRGRVPAGSGFLSLGGLVVDGPLARTVADAALLLDAIAGPSPWSVGPPLWDGGAYLNAAVRGEGRFQIGVMTTSPWDNDYDIAVSAEATAALSLATTQLDALGHGLDDLALDSDPTYAPAFRTLWQAGAASIPAEGDQLELLEPLTRWLVARGRELGARDLATALQQLSMFERSVIRQFDSFDVVMTPMLAMTPRPVGWYSQDDPELNFAQQVQYTPWTSFVNVSGLPAISLPISMTDAGLPMGVQLIGRPGRDDVLLALGAQLERRLGWHTRHPPQW
ncbi:amidase [Salinibacterium sp.]|uniref:amidase n=1 Tax=Salinibacterium sp. TaxID=1915057 RepID=UPI00286D2F8E|nr:amidase [Salinibacterium sp.]